MGGGAVGGLGVVHLDRLSIAVGLCMFMLGGGA